MNKNPPNLPLNRRSLRLQNYDYSQPGYYFVTICVRQRKCLLGEVKNGLMNLSALGKLVQSTWEQLPEFYPGVELDAFVVMPNHLHGIIALNVGAGPRACPPGHPRGGAPTMSLPDVVQRFKSISTHQYFQEFSKNKSSKSPSFLWQRNYYEHVIRRDESLGSIRKYIEENHLKWDLDEYHPQYKNSTSRTRGSPLPLINL